MIKKMFFSDLLTGNRKEMTIFSDLKISSWNTSVGSLIYSGSRVVKWVDKLVQKNIKFVIFLVYLNNS